MNLPPLSPLDLLLVSLLWTDTKTLTAWSPFRWPHSTRVSQEESRPRGG